MNHKYVVIDTNVLISALLKPISIPRKVLIKTLRQGILLESKQTFSEIETRIYRKKFDKYTTNKLRDDFLRSLSSQCAWIEPTEAITDCTADPDDNRFLELALAGQAAYIVTGDSDLLDMHPYQGIQILSPADFLERGFR